MIIMTISKQKDREFSGSTDQLEMNFNPEAVKRDRELNTFEGKYPDDLQRARSAARQYALENWGETKYGIPYSCTIEDVREILGIKPDINGRNKFLGSVFKESDWDNTGRIHRNNKTPGCHARPVPIWRLLTTGYKSNVSGP